MGRFAGRDILGRSRKFAIRAIRMVRAMPKEYVSAHLADQLVRSATSIGANLHEADMADTVKDFCNKVNIAQKEAGETVYWISLIREADILPAEKLAEIEAEAAEIQKVCRQIVYASRQNAR